MQEKKRYNRSSVDLRNLPHHLSPSERCETRRRQIEQECDIDLSALQIDPEKLGNAEERNCEQMFGYVPIPVGYAGPLHVTFSSGECADIHLPLATTEGALVASVNRGCKALRLAGGVNTSSIHHGISRSIALRIKNSVSTTSRVTLRCESATCMDSWLLRFASEHLTMTRRREPRMGDRLASMKKEIQKRENEWKSIGEATSNHLKILKYDIDTKDDYIFLTIYADTD
ncbi:hypothetical protein HYW84_04030 [Candidatus Peregrinibacteria bacterium]|nr:hypothetical protein [Candidatus Peregrinibacteria bacterium]